MVKEWSTQKKWNPFNSYKLLAQVYRWRLIKYRNSNVPQPALVTIDPTNNCNFSCIWCNSDYILQRRHQKLSKKKLIEIADFLAEWKGHPDWEKGVEAVCIAGGGESLLNPATPTLIDLLTEYGIEVGVVTNGTNLDKYKKALSKCTWVGVSVDAGTPETFQKIKKVDYFDKVISNMKELIDYSKENNTILGMNKPGYGVSYKFLLHPYNCQEILKSVKIAKDIGCKNFHLRPMGVPWDKLNDGSEVFDLPSISTFQDQLEESRKYETEKFGVYGVTHKFDSKLNIANQFKKCHAIFMTCAFMPSIDGNDDHVTVGLCCDRRGDERLELMQNESDVSKLDNLWGSKKHWDIFDSINLKDCPRCVPPETEIVTKDGMKKIEDINIGEKVLTHKGRFMKVEEKRSRSIEKNEKLLSLKFLGNSIPIKVTENHKIPVVSFKKCSVPSFNKRNQLCTHLCGYMKSFMKRTGKPAFCEEYYKYIDIEEKEAKDLIPNKHFLVIPKVKNSNKLSKGKSLMRLAGLYVAEGRIRKDDRRKNFYLTTFYFSAKEKELINDIKNIVKKKFKRDIHKPYYKNNSVTVSFSGKESYDFLKQFGNGAKNKKVPSWIFDCKDEEKIEFLRGYFKGDGNFGDKNNTVSASSISKNLLYQIRLLLNGLGISSSVYESNRKIGGSIKGRELKYTGKNYILKINQKTKNVDNLFNIKSNYHRKKLVSPKTAIEKDDFWLVKLKHKKFEEYNGKVWNIQVEKDHTYIAENVVVNNCTYQPHNQIYEHVIEDDSMTYKFI